MEKSFRYIIGAVVLGLLIVVMVLGAGRQVRRMDERVTLRQRDKIPYGTSVAKQLLPSLFPDAHVPYDNAYPGAWDSLDAEMDNQAVILIADYFDADEEELKRLGSFVAEGNYVFVVARSFSYDAAQHFGLSTGSTYDYYNYGMQDSLRVRLQAPAFGADSLFTYPGRRYDSHLEQLDTAKTAVLGRSGSGYVNFIRMDKGSGSFFIHTAPLAFSNYFILHKNNVTYFQNALSVIPRTVSTVLWSEYYLQKPFNASGNDKDKNWLSALFSYPAFKWGLLTALLTLTLFVLLGMRRRQRIIPPHEKPQNDSLDFVKTLGRLYYDRSDHKNLANKMSAYFLEHVRSNYKIATHTLDEEFVQSLHVKSGYPEPELKKIVTSIHNLKGWPTLGEGQLASFHRQLELFYQNT